MALVFGGGNLDISPLTVRLAELSGTRGNDWHLLSAGAFVSLIVPLIVFLACSATSSAGCSRAASRARTWSGAAGDVRGPRTSGRTPWGSGV